MQKWLRWKDQPILQKLLQENFKEAQLSNIELIEGSFEKSIPLVLEKFEIIDLLFIDGNHRKKSNFRIFRSFSEKIYSRLNFYF